MRFIMGASSSMVLCIAPTGSTPGAPPANPWTVTNSSATEGAFHDEPLSAGDGLFCISSTGTITARYVQR